MGKKYLLVFMLFLLAAAGTLPFSESNKAVADTGEIRVNAETLNVRTGPGLSYAISDSLERGEQLTTVSQSGDWYEVEIGGDTGWVASWLVAETSEQAAEGVAVASVDRLNVRAQPGLAASVLAQMNAGDQAQIIRESGDWLEVDFHNMRGFVSKQYITVSESNEENSASQQAGTTSFEIAVSALKVRTEPDLSSGIQVTVEKGQVFEIASTQGNWVQLQLSKQETGWVYAFHGYFSDQSGQAASADGDEMVTVLTNGTNLRAGIGTSSEVVSRADAGDRLTVKTRQGDWYEVELPNGENAFVASWVVTKEKTADQPETERTEEPKPDRKKGTLNGVTIVLDPGHGGNDGGTVGVRKTEEKQLTLKTAETLAHYLRSAGADVSLTRESDTYIDLRTRVAAAHQSAADAFISIHYDATDDNSVHGFTSYYMNDNQQELAGYVNEGLADKISLRDRGVQPGNYLVLRENRQPAVLVELGFLSNYNEERILSTSQFRDQAALGLYTGIINYFDAQLEN